MSRIDKFTEGVIYPIPAAFSEVGLNTESISQYLNYLHENGARTTLVTAGTSRFNLLHDIELKVFNGLVSQFKGNVILGLPPAANQNLLDHLHFYDQLEADALLAFYPDRYYDDDCIVEYFSWIAAQTKTPIMVHGMFMRNATGGMYDYQPGLVEKLKKIPNVIGMKEESSNMALAYKISRCASDDFLVFPAGGSCRRYLLTGPAGAQTFLGGIGNIFPEIEECFFAAFKDNEMEVAWDIVTKFEEPLFNVFGKIGWHKALQEALNYKKLLVTENRAPFSKITEEQAAAVHAVIDEIEEKWKQYE